VREAHVIVGRRGGKSAVASAIAVKWATMGRTWKLAAGETAVVPVIAADREQAGVLLGYCRGLLTETPRLKRMIKGKPARQGINLTNNAKIAIHTASFRTTRGYTLAAAICDETAFWRNEETSTNPDSEILKALRPGSTSGGPLICISSPCASRHALGRLQEELGQG
jgi:phage terminase large subunit-like protein